jgi:uncharacterized membrane protein
MKRLQPSLTFIEMFRSGMAIGQDMIGTMCQTLILAFVGSSLTTLLVLASYGTQFDQFMSSDYVAVEAAHSIAGSLSVIAAVPITSGLSALLGSARNKGNEKAAKSGDTLDFALYIASKPKLNNVSEQFLLSSSRSGR